MRLSVVDAADRPLPGASVQIGAGDSTPVDDTGGVDVPTPVERTTYTIQHKGLDDISVTLVPSGQNWLWDDPGSSLSMAPALILTVRLPSIRPAKPVIRAESELAYGEGRTTPSRPDGAICDTGGRYRALWDGPYWFHVAGPGLLGDADGKGWQRFVDAGGKLVDPSASGQFAFLEWGGLAGAPRLLVGVWAPWPKGPVVLEDATDVIVYYSPTTSAVRGYPADTPPYQGQYPFGLTTDGKSWGQPYLGVVQRHLFNEKFLVYQMLAAGLRVPMIFPVQPSANWQAFATRAGLGRLICEVLLWARRHQAPLLTYPQRSEPPMPGFRRTREAMWQHPPRLRSVVGSGFSAGVGGLVQLMANAALPKGFPDLVFGSDERVLNRAWTELWDFDGPREITGTTEIWQQRLNEWCQGERLVRLYHSTYTGWETSDLSKLDRLLPGAPIRPVKATGTAIREHSRRGSAAVFSAAYLRNGPQGEGWQQNPMPDRVPDRPDFWNIGGSPGEAAHQIVPIVCYGHAVGMSSLLKVK